MWETGLLCTFVPHEELGHDTFIKRPRRNSVHFGEGETYRTNDTSEIIRTFTIDARNKPSETYKKNP